MWYESNRWLARLDIVSHANSVENETIDNDLGHQ